MKSVVATHVRIESLRLLRSSLLKAGPRPSIAAGVIDLAIERRIKIHPRAFENMLLEFAIAISEDHDRVRGVRRLKDPAQKVGNEFEAKLHQSLSSPELAHSDKQQRLFAVPHQLGTVIDRPDGLHRYCSQCSQQDNKKEDRNRKRD